MRIYFLSDGLGNAPTSLDDINADVIETGIDLLFDESRRRVVYFVYPLSILGGQGCGSRHSIAFMHGNDPLIGFETPVYSHQLDNK